MSSHAPHVDLVITLCWRLLLECFACGAAAANSATGTVVLSRAPPQIKPSFLYQKTYRTYKY